MRRENNTA
jgi:V-type H+-transporting ATPase subunit B